MKTRNIILIFLFAALFTTQKLSGQNTIFNYQTGMCLCQGTYDSKLHTEEELQIIYELLWFAPYIQTDATAWELDKISDLSLSELENECNDKIHRLNAIKFKENSFWEELRIKRIQEMEYICMVKKFTIYSYEIPDFLMLAPVKDSMSNYYRDALIQGGDALLSAWKVMLENQKQNNSNPERLQAEFDEMYNSPQQLEYARLEVTLFGWWNSANGENNYVDQYLDIESEFKKLFTNVDCDCEEP